MLEQPTDDVSVDSRINEASTTIAEGKLEWLDLGLLYESPNNPRKYFPEASMAELVASMKASGYHQWLPLMVRPVPTDEGPEPVLYEIGAGHRRSRAAREAGITIVPCIVREMDDAEFLDVLNFDNSSREDVHPLHEAEGWQQWMNQTGKGVLDIAAKIGKSKEYVYQRLKYSALSPDGKKAFLDGEISSAHAILIARLQAPEQKKALKFSMPPGWKQNKPGVRDLASFIQRDVHLGMGRATFDLASTDLVPAAGSCNACPKRTKNSPELLLGIEVAADPDSDDCTDPSCFNSKLNAHIASLKAKLEASGKKPVEVMGGYGKVKKGALGHGEYRQVQEGTKGAQSAIVADGFNAGKLIHIEVVAKTPTPSRQDPQAAAKAQEARQARIDLELSVRRAILDTIRAKVVDVSRVDVEVLLTDCLGNGTASEEELERLYPALKDCYGPNVEAAVAKLSNQQIYQMAVTIPLLEDFDDYRVINSPPDRLLAAAKRYKVDASKIRIQVEGAAAKKPAAATCPTAPPADKKPLAVPPPKKKTAAKKKPAAAPKPAAKKKGKAK